MSSRSLAAGQRGPGAFVLQDAVVEEIGDAMEVQTSHLAQRARRGLVDGVELDVALQLVEEALGHAPTLLHESSRRNDRQLGAARARNPCAARPARRATGSPGAVRAALRIRGHARCKTRIAASRPRGRRS
jgi:hypothetical protein